MPRPQRCLWAVFMGLAVTFLVANSEKVFATVPREHEPPPMADSAMPVWEAVSLGLIEGMTEYLPVSSTGHLLIFQHWLGRSETSSQKDADDAFAICIQLGAILAVVVLYFGRLKQILRGMLGADPEGRKLLVNLVVAFVPAVVVGLLFQKPIKAHLFAIRPITLAVLTGGLLILLTSRMRMSSTQTQERSLMDLTWRQSLLIGCLQCIAFWPGFSRSLATILGCRAVGLRMLDSMEFSFLLGLMTLGAATVKEGISHGDEIIAHHGLTSPVLALVVAFVAAVISVKFMIGFLGRYGLAPFGYYRLALAAACYWLLW